MVKLEGADWQKRPGIAALVTALGGADEVRFVGGAVRDGLLRLPVSDIDMATRHRPEAVVAMLEGAGIKAVPTGIAHGTVTAVSEGSVVEVTTLRRDVATDGRHAVVAYTSDWQEDAARRDFTINALFADPQTGEVFDWFGGVADLHAGCVRFIGDPRARIAEDHLRILRFFRFHARFGRGDPDIAALDACAARANDLMALSRERIADELLKLLATAAPLAALRLMLGRDILKPVLPEIATPDSLDRLIAREADLQVPGDSIRRLAALIGPRPETAAQIAARLRLSKAKAKRLVAACIVDAPQTVGALAYRIGVESAIDRLLLGNGDAADLASLDGWTRPVLPIAGGTLVARGLTPGPVVAATLSAIETAWIAEGFPSGRAFDGIVKNALSAANRAQI